MSMLVNPYIYGGVAPPFYFYATWDSANADISDGGSYHSTGTFTVPTGWNGRKVRVSAGGLVSAAALAVSTSKNGTVFDGMGYSTFPNSGAVSDGGTVHSAPVVVLTGDTLTCAGGSLADGTWRGVELLPSGVDGALVNRITSGFAHGTTATIIEWNNEVYDTDTYHDNSVNPSRLTPQGASGLIRLQANVALSATQAEIRLEFYQNGVATGYTGESVDEWYNLMSPPLTYTAGDYFEVAVDPNVAGDVNVDERSWFAIEELDPALQYAICEFSAGQSIPSGSVWTAITAGTQLVDVGGWFTPSTSYFTVPSGVTKVRVGYTARNTTGIPSACEIAIFKNGAAFNQMPSNSQVTAGSEFNHAVSTIIECTAGDTFDFRARTGFGAQAIAIGSRFWIEEVPDVTS